MTKKLFTTFTGIGSIFGLSIGNHLNLFSINELNKDNNLFVGGGAKVIIDLFLIIKKRAFKIKRKILKKNKNIA